VLLRGCEELLGKRCYLLVSREGGGEVWLWGCEAGCLFLCAAWRANCIHICVCMEGAVSTFSLLISMLY
jgi:hypothetical protein